MDNPTVQLLELEITEPQITLTNQQASNTNFIFTGTLTEDSIIFVSGSFNIFFVNNLTTGPFSLSMQIIGNSASLLLLVPITTLLISNDGFTLRILKPS